MPHTIVTYREATRPTPISHLYTGGTANARKHLTQFGVIWDDGKKLSGHYHDHNGAKWLVSVSSVAVTYVNPNPPFTIA